MQSELYHVLMSNAAGGHCDGFDAHVAASALAIAAGAEPQSMLEGTGLEREQLLELASEVFPALRETLATVLPRDVAITRTPDEACLRELLGRATNGTPVSLCFATIIARRCLQPNHLWQDLGLRNRRELSWLMERHFPMLASRNRSDMKWKKFLYRTICRDEGFGLCVAPVCDECSDYEGCFGAEEGAELLARSA